MLICDQDQQPTGKQSPVFQSHRQTQSYQQEQRYNQYANSYYNSSSSFFAGDKSATRSIMSVEFGQSPKDVTDKIEFINKLYSDLKTDNNTSITQKSQFKNKNKFIASPKQTISLRQVGFQANKYDRESPLINKKNNEFSTPVHSHRDKSLHKQSAMSKSTDTPEQMQPVQPVMLETNSQNKYWTFQSNQKDDDKNVDVSIIDRQENKSGNKDWGSILREVNPKQNIQKKPPTVTGRNEQMINSLFEELCIKDSLKKKSSNKNFVELNKQPRSGLHTYHKTLESLERRFRNSRSRTPSTQHKQQSPPRQQSKEHKKKISQHSHNDNKRQSSSIYDQYLQGKCQTMSLRSLQLEDSMNTQNFNQIQQKSHINEEYDYFLQEINKMTRQVNQASDSLMKTIQNIMKSDREVTPRK